MRKQSLLSPHAIDPHPAREIVWGFPCATVYPVILTRVSCGWGRIRDPVGKAYGRVDAEIRTSSCICGSPSGLGGGSADEFHVRGDFHLIYSCGSRPSGEVCCWKLISHWTWSQVADFEDGFAAGGLLDLLLLVMLELTDHFDRRIDDPISRKLRLSRGSWDWSD